MDNQKGEDVKNLSMLVLFLGMSGICSAADYVNIPWEEFKTLYKESIEKKVLAAQDAEPFIYRIDQAAYRLRLTPGRGIGQMMIQGGAISGKPRLIPLFNKNMIIKEIINITGGVLLCEQEDNQGILFWPEKQADFLIEFSFYLPVQEDTRSRFVDIKIPNALKNTLTLELSKELVLLEAPGIKDRKGNYNFSAQPALMVRFSDQKQNAENTRINNLSKHFKPVRTPSLVLDSVSYFTSFEENGSVLNVLVMDVPKTAKSYVEIDAIPGTRIWSLKVNHQHKKIYSKGPKGAKWIIPLSRRKTSHVELAMIQHGKKLGLHGRLETALPGLALAARKVNMAIALPHRVRLISFEGPLTSGAKNSVPPPKEFIGNPYYFSRAFYKGQGMTIAVMYKEPVK